MDENKDLEAYIYVPTERSSEVRNGLEVDLTDNAAICWKSRRLTSVSAQVDSALQGVLVKAPVHSTSEILRNAQMVKARVIWSTKPMATVPVLAVTRQGGQSFVYVAQQQGAIFWLCRRRSRSATRSATRIQFSPGLNPGDRVIVSGTQFLVNGMPVMPMGG